MILMSKTPVEMKIAVANNSQLPGINELYKKLHPVEARGKEKPINDVNAAAIKSYPLLTSVDGRPVAFLLLLLIEYWDFKYASIEELFVDEKFRNRKFATKLIDKAITICRKENALAILIETDKDNPAAMSLYKKCGFIDDSEGRFKLKLSKKT